MSNYPGKAYSKAIHDEKTIDLPINSPEQEITLLWHTADVLAAQIRDLKAGQVYAQNLCEIKMLFTRMRELIDRLELLTDIDDGTPRG
jgi:hypothetical protein